MKKIKIKNRNNQKLSGIFYPNKSSKEIIIGCHGSRGFKENPRNKIFSKSLTKDYNFFCFDFSGNGKSEGKLEDSTYSKDINDLIDIIKYFQNKRYNIKCVIGHSKSATDVLLASQRLYNLKVSEIIALAPRINLKKAQEWVEYKKQKKLKKNLKSFFMPKSTPPHKVTNNYLKNLIKFHNVKDHYSKKIKTTIIHGSKDEIINISESIDFCKKFKSVNLIRINSANHGFTSHLKRLDRIVNKILSA